ncbi:MAG: adenosylcobinamide-phosphate synthase CbiB [Sedimentitalea sp.]
MTAAILTVALLLDARLGEPTWLWSRLPHPAVLMGRAVSALDRGWNSGAHRKLAGVAALLTLSVAACAIGVLLQQAGALVTILVAAILLAQKSLVDHVQAVADALQVSLADGRKQVGWIVSRDVGEMDRSQVARSAIESASENLSDGVIAPAFWFLIAGLPGLLVYKIINTADSMIGYRTPRHVDFGWAAARTDDLVNLIPARLTGLIIVALSGQLPHMRAIVADARQHLSPNAGWSEAAMARAIDVALAGPRSYDGQMRELPWVNGAGRRNIGSKDIRAAIKVLWQCWAVMLCAVIAIATARALWII